VSLVGVVAAGNAFSDRQIGSPSRNKAKFSEDLSDDNLF
jgi:hypothetical protein